MQAIAAGQGDILGVAMPARTTAAASAGRRAVGSATIEHSPVRTSASAGALLVHPSETRDVDESRKVAEPVLPRVTIAEAPPEYRNDTGPFSRLQQRPGLGIVLSDHVSAHIHYSGVV